MVDATRRNLIIAGGALTGIVGGAGCLAKAYQVDTLDEHNIDPEASVERAYVMGECSLYVEGYVQGNGDDRHVRLYGYNRDGAVVGTMSAVIETFNDDRYVFKLGIPDKNCGIGNVRGYGVTVDEDDEVSA